MLTPFLVALLAVGVAAAQPMVVERVVVAGAIREVWVHVPAGPAADPLRPLVIAFHGGGSHAREMASCWRRSMRWCRGTRWTRAAYT